jgi:hypothetical protein
MENSEDLGGPWGALLPPRKSGEAGYLDYLRGPPWLSAFSVVKSWLDGRHARHPVRKISRTISLGAAQI